MVTLCLPFLSFEKLSNCFPPFYIPTGEVQGFQFLHLLIHTYFLFYSSHPNKCEVASSFGFDFNFSND